MNTVNLIAYRGTGKDMLTQALIQACANQNKNELKSLEWKVYAPPFQQPINFDLYPPVRVALADALKEELCDEFNIPHEFIHSGEFEKYKDVPRADCPRVLEKALQEAGYPRCREAMIDMAKRRKSQHGPKYYVNLIEDKIQQAHQDGQTVLLTDVRDYHDLRPGLNVRLFRSDIPIPPANDMSERKMDHCSTDYLLCRNVQDLIRIQLIQPQYKHYVYRAELADIVTFIRS